VPVCEHPQLYCVAVDLDQPQIGFELVAACSKIGAIARQGQHQIAQKSTNSGMSLCVACLSKRATLSSAAGRPS
jgi:hypothetical protein